LPRADRDLVGGLGLRNTGRPVRAWVTGATGFVGSTLVERLKVRGDQVVAFVRPQSLHAAPAGVDVAQGVLPDVSALRRLPAPDVVFHCAAAIDCNERDGRAVHIDGTLALTEAARGARFVHVSTTDVLGEPSGDRTLSEQSTCAPVDAYGRTKLEAELSLMDARSDAVVLRPPGIYGPRSNRDVVLHIAQKIDRGRFYHVGNGEALRSWVFVETLVDAMLHVAARSELSGVFFVDDSRPVSRRELAAEIARELGRSPRFLRIPLPIAWAAGWCAERLAPAVGLDPPITTRGVSFRTSALPLDTTRLRATGFAHRFTLRESIQATLSWARAAGKLAG
jgi:nucleoside-diphosphate-sugar epimerase